ncbi:hypothetical protein DL96DRAFT_1626357 [Flagelloscypha sp. PMI_526]|nr:hypothetical protein DL96DRAFT_1626357 [Flagelloscypha sp. PMI_526]
MDPSESAELQALRLHLEDPDGQASNLPKNPWHEHHPHPAIDNGRVFVYNCTFRKQNRSVPLDRWPYLRRLAEADIPNDPNEAGEDTVIELDYNQMFGRGSPRDNGDPPGFPGDIFIDLDKAPRAMWICMGDFWEETVANQTDTAEDMVPLPKHPLLWGTYLNSDENNGFGWRSQHFVEEKGIAIPNPRATATARREPKFLCNLRDIIETGCQWPPCRSASVLIKPVNRAVVDAPPLQPPLPLPLPQSQQNPVVTVPRDFLPRPPARVSPARETSQPGQNSIHTFEILKTHGTKRKSVESNQGLLRLFNIFLPSN